MKFKLDISKLYVQVNTFVGRYFRWTAIGVLALVLLLGWLLVLSSEYRTIRQSGILGYETTSERYDDRTAYLNSLQELQDRYNSLEAERLRQIESTLPVGVDAVELITHMNTFAERAQAQILSIDVTRSSVQDETVAPVEEEDEESTTANPTFTSDDIQVATIAVNIATPTGSYEELKRFLDELESFVPVLNLYSLTYSNETTSYALDLQTYYLDEPSS